MNRDQPRLSRFIAKARRARHQFELSGGLDREGDYRSGADVGDVDKFAIGHERYTQWLLQTAAAKGRQGFERTGGAVDRVFTDRSRAGLAVAGLAGIGYI